MYSSPQSRILAVECAVRSSPPPSLARFQKLRRPTCREAESAARPGSSACTTPGKRYCADRNPLRCWLSRHRHRQFVGICADGFKIGACSKVGVRAPPNPCPAVAHRFHNVLLHKSCDAARSKVADVERGMPRRRSIFSQSLVFARAYRMSSSSSLSRFRLARVFSSSIIVSA